MRKNFLIGLIIVVAILVAGSIAYIHGKNSSLASLQNNTNSITNNSAVLENNTANSTNNSSSASNNSATGNYSSTNNSSSMNSNNSNVNNGSASSSNSSSANMNAANGTNSTGNAKGYEAYFGQWNITKSVGTLPIYAMSEEDIKGYVGKKITISKNEFADTNGLVQSPRYEVKTVSGSEFFNENKIKLSAIGVNGNSITELTIYSPEGKAYNKIYLLDNNTIIYLWNGVFFQAEK